MRKVRAIGWLIVGFAAWGIGASAQDAATPPQKPAPNSVAPRSGPAANLYDQLRAVGLNAARVYHVREASIDRADLHFTLNDGTIGFTADVLGRITGAFFNGDGEVLLVPPNQVERSSMALFTGAAILEEHFASAYFRFNDDTYAELQTSLTPNENAADFVARWDQDARTLAQEDALRLLMTFSNFLPSAGPAERSADADKNSHSDRMLHARVEGIKLGVFDVRFDSLAAEQIWAGQAKNSSGESFYDLWTSFSPRPPLKPHIAHPDSESGIGEEGSKADTYNLFRYRIRSQVRPPTTLDADATVTMQVRQGGQRTVVFELSRFLVVKKVEADGHAIEFIHNQSLEGTQLARLGNDVVAIIFPRPLRTGDHVELHFVYGGDVLSEAGNGLLYVGARGIWYPNRGPAMSNFDLEFHYPATWTLLATGKRSDAAADTSSHDSGEAAALPGEQVGRWISERAIPFAGFNLGKYSRMVAHAGTISVEAYATPGLEREFPKLKAEEEFTPLPTRPGAIRSPVPIPPPPTPSPARNAQSVAQTSAHAIEFFARRFGPFPYGELTLTQMPGTMSQGWPGLVFLSSFSFLTSEEKSRLHVNALDITLSDSVIAHETAHQWWGDLVLWNGYRNQWIMEALANYSALMLMEAENPRHFRAVMDGYRADLLQANKNNKRLNEAGPVTLGARLSSSQFPNGYTAVSYGRGTWLFHMLRHMMLDAARGEASGTTGGTDEPFVRTLRKIRERYQGESITTEELLRMFEEQLPRSLWHEGQKSLDWFYQGWINGAAVPKFELHGVKYTDKGAATIVSGTIEQQEAPKELITSIPVYASRSGRNALLGRIFADGPETEFRLTAPAGTRKILLDPYRVVLSRNH
ncbi:MAG: hypothetical protein M3O09_19005 [Acidobacteriota bacterium]|nr:hypothetical protein [Acidobacteriota bacterium]